MLSCILALLLALGTWACSTPSAAPQDAQATSSAVTVQVEHGSSYTSKEEVGAYLHEYGELPPNFISKTKAKKAGWVPSEGNLDEVCPGMSIGGSVFYNDDGKLPDAEGRTWHECDIDYHGGMRGPERIVWSTDGLIYYTPDHYETFEQLY
jgi:guanyl-specific ribonuclease Sa